jgi:hypothetical protein
MSKTSINGIAMPSRIVDGLSLFSANFNPFTSILHDGKFISFNA